MIPLSSLPDISDSERWRLRIFAESEPNAEVYVPPIPLSNSWPNLLDKKGPAVDLVKSAGSGQ